MIHPIIGIMDISLSKDEIKIDPASPPGDLIDVSPKSLRSQIKTLISDFISRPKPIKPTDAEIMNDFLVQKVPEFAAVNKRIVDLDLEIRSTSPKNKTRLTRQLESAKARRLALIADAASSEDFLIFRSEKKAAFNEIFIRYNEEAVTIGELKPFLGMTHLPAIQTRSLNADIILAHLKEVKGSAAEKGDMILREGEEIHKRKQFFPRAALRNGISDHLLREGLNGVVRVPYSPFENFGVEAIALGAFERRGRVYFKLQGGKPVAQSHWNEIDRFLPFACRSISVPFLPVISNSPSGFSFRTVFGDATWDAISEEILEKHAGSCVICGSDDKVSITPRWSYKEPVIGSSAPGVQELDSFLPFCANCMDTLRPSLDSLLVKSSDGLVLSTTKEREGWLRTINRWNEPKEKAYVSDAYVMAIEMFRRRSRVNWIVDISKQTSVYLGLEEGFYVDDDDWVWPNVGSPFKIVGAPYFEGQNQSRIYIKPPKIHCVGWDSTVENVIEKLEASNLSVADKRGAGFVVDRPMDPIAPFSPELEKRISAVTDATFEEIEVNVEERPSSSTLTISGNLDDSPPFIPDNSVQRELGAGMDDDYDDDDDDEAAFRNAKPDYN